MKPETWFALFIASWAISLSPGAGAVAAMSSGLRHGLKRGYWTVSGLQLGVLRQPRHVRWINRAFGAMFVGAAALLAGFRRAV